MGPSPSPSADRFPKSPKNTQGSSLPGPKADQSGFGEGRPKERAGEEMSDIFIYLLSLAEVLDIDLLSAARAKLEHARLRFPAAEVVSVAPEKA